MRREQPGDEVAVARVHEAAFGQADESRIVAAIRRAGHPSISLVAVDGVTVVGHILFTPVVVEAARPALGVMGLGPMAVVPARQRRGVGSALVEEGLQECTRAGCRAVVVVGHPEYYARFGFRPASSYGLRCEYPVPDEVFMAIELAPGALDRRGGLVRYLAEFGGEGGGADPRQRPAGGAPKLYGELASWWPLLSAPADYAEEAAFYERTLVSACDGAARTLLELGSGGGNNASHLKARFRMVLVDRSPGMLAVSRALNPECEHIEGDMRSVRLGRTFDCIFVHDAVVYMTSESDLRRVIETAFLHCRPGGAALFAPDHVRETFRPSTDHGGHDGGGRSLRYLEWTWDPDPTDTTYLVDFAYLLREADGQLRVEYDRHTAGLFARADWLRLLSETGFGPTVAPFGPAELEAGISEVFVGRKPGGVTRLQ